MKGYRMNDKVELGVNNTFTLKKWVEPDEWIRVIVEEIGLNNIQLSSDLFYPNLDDFNIDFMCNRINDSLDKYDAKISSTFTGLNIYSQNMLGHPNPVVRKSALEYFINAIKISSKINAATTGGHFMAFSIKDFNDNKKREYLTQSLFESVIYLSSVAKDHGLDSLTIEYMPTPYEFIHRPDQAKEILNEINNYSKIPVYLTFDLGHTCSFNLEINGPDRDIYNVLENIIPITNIIHLQQTDGKSDHHWPFIPEYNENGIIKPREILKLIKDSSDHKIDLIFELLHGCDVNAEKIISDHKYSVDYWMRCM